MTLIGDYFIDDPNVPLTITMAGNVEVTNITNITKTAVSFILPDNAPAGYINVKSIYGTGRSKFRYHDTRNILFDWDGSHGGMAIAHGWRDGSAVLKEADENSIDGAYIVLPGNLKGESVLLGMKNIFHSITGRNRLPVIPNFLHVLSLQNCSRSMVSMVCN